MTKKIDKSINFIYCTMNLSLTLKPHLLFFLKQHFDSTFMVFNDVKSISGYIITTVKGVFYWILETKIIINNRRVKINNSM